MTATAKTLHVADLDAAIAAHEAEGFRLDMIMPADAPRVALVSRKGNTLRLVASDRAAPPAATGEQPFHIMRANAEAWSPGRAGMQYRDLIPGR